MPPQSRTSERARQVTAVTLELVNGEQGSPFTYTFNITPQGVDFTMASRANPQQTLGGAYVEEWGEGLAKLVLSGHTGFSLRVPFQGMPEVDGYKAFQDLKAFLKRYLDALTLQRLATEIERKPLTLIAHLWESDDHFEVTLDGDALRVARSDQTPLLFPYTVTFTILGPGSASKGLKNTLFGVDPFGIASTLEQAEGELLGAAGDFLGGLPITEGLNLRQAVDGAVSAARFGRELLKSPGALMGHYTNRLNQGAMAARSVQREVATFGDAIDFNRRAGIELSRAARHLECAIGLTGPALEGQGKGPRATRDSLWAAAQRARMGC